MIVQRKKSCDKGEQNKTNLNFSGVEEKDETSSTTSVHPEPSLDPMSNAILSRDGGIKSSKIITCDKVGCITDNCAIKSGISITQSSISRTHPNLLPNSPSVP
ncbi:hypothetical protein LOK49_LG02G03089 [Camellia lanceoleosa]|uniref:Uncharacterized protein n=1 Tax=Camellia lanceoleosa TaxID=1840588 RepID=A0ACC0IRJ1_9ERIC|nr:hypothetical protein LOK49_LG02G03089 [Camellia lanceoleosa]